MAEFAASVSGLWTHLLTSMAQSFVDRAFSSFKTLTALLRSSTFQTSVVLLNVVKALHALTAIGTQESTSDKGT